MQQPSRPWSVALAGYAEPPDGGLLSLLFQVPRKNPSGNAVNPLVECDVTANHQNGVRSSKKGLRSNLQLCQIKITQSEESF